MTFEAVIFDCDGVLVDSEVLAIRGERKALEVFGLSYSPEDYVRRFVGLHDGAFFAALREDFKSQHGAGGRRTDLKRKFSKGGAANAIYCKSLTRRATPCGFANARYAVAVASSSRAHYLKSKLERTSLYELAAPHVYSADLVANGKPAPDIFLYTAERLGVAPSACLVLEDSENGVKAGLRSGHDILGISWRRSLLRRSWRAVESRRR